MTNPTLLTTSKAATPIPVDTEPEAKTLPEYYASVAEWRPRAHVITSFASATLLLSAPNADERFLIRNVAITPSNGEPGSVLSVLLSNTAGAVEPLLATEVIGESTNVQETPTTAVAIANPSPPPPATFWPQGTMLEEGLPLYATPTQEVGVTTALYISYEYARVPAAVP